MDEMKEIEKNEETGTPGETTRRSPYSSIY